MSDERLMRRDRYGAILVGIAAHTMLGIRIVKRRDGRTAPETRYLQLGGFGVIYYWEVFMLTDHCWSIQENRPCCAGKRREPVCLSTIARQADISGMSGAVMVLPREGLRDKTGKLLHYDRIYYIGENDFYVPRGDDGKFQSFTDASDFFPKTLELMRKLVPTHVVFEGKVGALTGKNALEAKVGETVLIVHSQANRDSRPHLIGRHGDYVWETGKFHNPWFSAGVEFRSRREAGLQKNRYRQ
jgi:hypothetical protein